ncbi:multidrug effflux MFS transporter [Pseudomonas sp. ICMP22404]|uniref:multidrug effflux MFS transporter n=1 Tax=Pseudomonas sp. ICMP22404 TaxID=2583807 RepID=UPI00111B1828|nr:multidrug effflux MFS transporter [Pseudomonas sp. ICMP22404]TNF83375.1 multidrug effflux MFS transporter [Pseudomonas sp. ICMP22404]
MLENEPAPRRMRFNEFVLFVSVATAIGALSTYIVLPGLTQIGNDLRLTDISHSQAVISAYLIGFGTSQLVFGPLSDSFGRKGSLLVGLMIFLLGSALSGVSTDFSVMLAGRFLQGVGGGAGRVISTSMLRDSYVGQDLGRALSYVTLVFGLFPAVAPLLGQVILDLASWRWMFALLAAAGLTVAVWATLRLGETLDPERRRPFSWGAFRGALAIIFSTRKTATCILVLGLTLASNYAFIGLSHQVFSQLFHAEHLFTPLFGFIASMLVLAALANAWLLRRLTLRFVVQHTLIAAVAVNVLYLLCACLGWVSLPVYVLLQAVSTFLFGLTLPNLYALAMEPVASVAGTASAVIGFLMTIMGTCLGFFLGQLFDGSLLPIAAGYLLFSTLAMVSAQIAQRWRK